MFYPMKKCWIVFPFMLLLFSCTHKITRFGYKPAENIHNTNCVVQIVSEGQLLIDSTYTELGKVRLGDKGFSTRCGSAEAKEILRNEACALNANTVVITDAIDPDIISTCFRCRATFYRTSNPTDPNPNTPLKRDDILGKSNVQKSNAGAQVLGYVAGFLVGYFLVSLMF